MPNILDIYSDTSLHGLVNSLRDNPEYYDSISKTPIDYDEKETLPSSAFAWPEERAYPINGKEMAMLSSLYRSTFPPESEGVDVPEYVDENIKKASYLYDFKIPEKKQVKTASATMLKEADFVLPKQRKFPVTSAKDACIVQRLIVKNAHIMGYDHLAEACTNLLTKMASFNVDAKEVSPLIYKYAGMTLSNKDILDAAILRRTDFCAPTYREPYYKLAHMVEEMDYNRFNLLKVASVLEQLDKVAKVRHLYDKHILNPMESVFNTNKLYNAIEKRASTEVFTEDMLGKINPEVVKSALGEDILLEMQSPDGSLNKGMALEVINSLPTEMVKDFVDRIK